MVTPVGIAARVRRPLAVVIPRAKPYVIPLAAAVVGAVCDVIGYADRLVFATTLGNETRLERTSKFLSDRKPVRKTKDEKNAERAWTRRRIFETLSALQRTNGIARPLLVREDRRVYH